MDIWSAPPLDLRGSLRAERRELLELLRNLGEREWFIPTCCPGWRVKDMALHLLDDDLGGWLAAVTGI